ncbi:MAG: hypothetical protein IPP40_15985 [bacterium]|nr:hypothetical protein [bacterium]
MRLLSVLLYLFIVIAVGCVPEGDTINNSYNYYYPDDTTGNPDTTYSVQITYPARNEAVEIWYDWFELASPGYYNCPWILRTDTTISAEVSTNVPGTIIQANVFLQTSPSGSFYQSTVMPYPGGSSFSIRLYRFSPSNSVIIPPDQNFAFWVSLTTDDSMNYISPTVSFRLVSKVNYDMESAPEVPVVDTLFETDYTQRMTTKWCPQSPNIDSFYVSYRETMTGQVRRFAYQSSTRESNYTRYLPTTAYSVWVTAANGYGESAASDTLNLTTTEPILPEHLGATIYSDGSVDIQWNCPCYPDSMLVARKDTLSDWSTIQSLYCNSGYCPSHYEDSTAASNTVYYYRVGVQFRNGIWWTPDSVAVWVP